MIEEKEDKQKQIKIRSKNGKWLYLPVKLKYDLDILLDDMVHSEMDIVIIIDGQEGVGKSYTGRLVGKYCSIITNSKFGPENIHFSAKDYIMDSEKRKKFHVNILDESREALNKRRAMAKSNVMFTNWLSENRDKQQVHILILPAIHDLDSYVAIWRMSLLIHHVKWHKENTERRGGHELKRGYFRVFENNKDLQRVMHNKSRYGHYSYPKIAKYQRFIRYVEVFTPTELELYKKKKIEKRTIKYTEKGPTNTEKRWNEQRKKLAIELLKEGKTQVAISKISGIERTDLSRWYTEYRDDSKLSKV